MAAHANFVEIHFIHAGQHGDAENHQRRIHRACGFDRGVDHPAATGGVDGQHADAESCGFAHCGGNRVGNVVILQVQKDPPARGHEVAHHARPFGGVELHPDFEGQSRDAHGRHDLLGGGRGRNI